jgi:hypothetical protein
MSLSMPLGPSVVRTTSLTAVHALMLLISCGLPWLVSVPSLSRITCGACSAPKMHLRGCSALARPSMGASMLCASSEFKADEARQARMVVAAIHSNVEKKPTIMCDMMFKPVRVRQTVCIRLIMRASITPT